MSASIADIRKHLHNQDHATLIKICLRLAKYKKENKELIHFILFESGDTSAFIQQVKDETDTFFREMNASNVYFIKKTLRKIVRYIARSNRFLEEKQDQAQVLIHFCNCIITYQIPIHKSKQLRNIYESHRKKLTEIINKLHPDLQYDFYNLLISPEK